MSVWFSGIALIFSTGALVFKSSRVYTQDTSRLELLITREIGGLSKQLALIPSEVMEMVTKEFVSKEKHDLQYEALARRITMLEDRNHG